MKKIVCLVLAIMMLASVVPMVYATTNYTNGTDVEYDVEANETYTVTVPAKLIPGGAAGTVTLTGTWASDRKITVDADDTVELTNSINAQNKKTLAVTFAGIEEAGDNTEEKTYTESVSVAAIEDALFGKWTGHFDYTVVAADVQAG